MTQPTANTPTCPRHPGQAAFVRCQRCGRPTCHECQRPAAVGIQCVDCVAEQAKAAPTTRTVFGGHSAAGRPFVTIAIIAVCVVVWLLQLASSRVTDDLSYVPALSGDEPWRFLTAAFVHSPGSPLHLGFNMYALWICGQYLEPMLGRARFAALYLIAALGGSVGFELLASVPASVEDTSHLGWLTQTVGASGAVFGLFAAVVVLNRKLGRDITPMLTLIGVNAVLGFVVSGIAWQSHLGGLVTGAAVAGALAASPRRSSVAWGAMGGVVLVLVALAVWRYQSVHLPM